MADRCPAMPVGIQLPLLLPIPKRVTYSATVDAADTPNAIIKKKSRFGRISSKLFFVIALGEPTASGVAAYITLFGAR